MSMIETFQDEFQEDLRFGVMEFSTSSSQQLTLTPAANRSDIDEHLDGMMKNDGYLNYHLVSNSQKELIY